MMQKNKIFSAAAILTTSVVLVACSSPDYSSSLDHTIPVSQNLGATTGLPEVVKNVDKLQVSHMQIKNRFDALETLYVDMKKANYEYDNMVAGIKEIQAENAILKKDIQLLQDRLRASDALSSKLSKRIDSLENTLKNAVKMSEKKGQLTLSYAVHLASFRKPEQLVPGWKELQKKFPESLGSLSAKVEESTLPQIGAFFKLLAGPFQSQAEADALCATLKAGNQYCQSASFAGKVLQ